MDQFLKPSLPISRRRTHPDYAPTEALPHFQGRASSLSFATRTQSAASRTRLFQIPAAGAYAWRALEMTPDRRALCFAGAPFLLLVSLIHREHGRNEHAVDPNASEGSEERTAL